MSIVSTSCQFAACGSVFPSANGIGMHVIKGARELQVVTASGRSEQFVTDAIPCIDQEQAIAAEQLWGDGQLKCN